MTEVSTKESKNKQYRYEPLSRGNLADYLAVTANCSYSFARDLEQHLLKCHLNDGGTGRVVIYEGKTPVAVFSGERTIERISRLPFSVNCLRAHSAGLLVAVTYMEKIESLREFVFVRLLNEYYLKTLNMDYVSFIAPPKVTITMPERVFQFVPFYSCLIDVNSLVYAKLGDNLLGSYKYNTRYETRKGLEALLKFQVLRGREIDVRKHLMPLVLLQAEELGLKPKPPEHFERLLKGNYHHCLAAVSEDGPLSALIYTCANGVATFTFNASSRDAKKMFINKGLLYTAMKESEQKGAEYFALGDGKEFSGNMLNVCFFKRSFANRETVNCRYIYPLSFLGHILIGFRQIRRMGQIKNALIGKQMLIKSGNELTR